MATKRNKEQKLYEQNMDGDRKKLMKAIEQAFRDLLTTPPDKTALENMFMTDRAKARYYLLGICHASEASRKPTTNEIYWMLEKVKAEVVVNEKDE